jgi:integrase/recombinase XerD
MEYIQEVIQMVMTDYLEEDFLKMLTYREAAGYATVTYKVTLMPFIVFCCENYPYASGITREMVDAWLAVKKYSINTQAAFIACLRQYCRYINFLGQKAYVPDEDYTIKRVSYEPYMFTDYELHTLFDAIDGYKASTNNKKYRPELVVSPMFRLMYCCGMRPAEPLHLKCEDVNLDTGDIYIRETKHHKDRHIIISSDMLELCQTYDRIAGNRTWFFEYKDRPYERKWMTSQFHHCWKCSGLIKHGNPRPYDLRHAFTTRNLIKWIDKGSDVISLFPYLSTYMGHATLNSTFYYLHLLPERIRNSAGIEWEQFSAIYGEEGGNIED